MEAEGNTSAKVSSHQGHIREGLDRRPAKKECAATDKVDRSTLRVHLGLATQKPIDVNNWQKADCEPFGIGSGQLLYPVNGLRTRQVLYRWQEKELLYRRWNGVFSTLRWCSWVMMTCYLVGDYMQKFAIHAFCRNKEIGANGENFSNDVLVFKWIFYVADLKYWSWK